MNAVPTPLLAHMGRVIAVTLVVLTLMLMTANVSVAVVHEGTPSIAARAETVPSARDDCLTGRRRTGPRALRLGVDPAPSCASLLADHWDAAGRRPPGVLQ